MAIIKKIIEKNGVETNYHKIKNIKIENDNGNITYKFEIENYTTQEFRNKEKNKTEIEEKLNELRNKLNDEYKNEPINEIEVNKIVEEINYNEGIINQKDYYSASTTEFIINKYENEEEISNFYNILKNTNEYNNSKDI